MNAKGFYCQLHHVYAKQAIFAVFNLPFQGLCNSPCHVVFWASIWPQQCPSDNIYTLNAQEHRSSACWGQQMPRKPLGLKECADQLTRVKTNMFHQSVSVLPDTIIPPLCHCKVKKMIWSYIHHKGNVCGLLEELTQHTSTLTRIVWSCQTVNFWGCAWIWDGSTHMHSGKKGEANTLVGKSWILRF